MSFILVVSKAALSEAALSKFPKEHTALNGMVLSDPEESGTQ